MFTLYSCNMGESGLPDIYTWSLRATGLRAEGVYIRQTMSAHVTTIMWHLVIGYKSTYVSSKHYTDKHITTPYLLGCKYNCEIIYSRMKFPTKAFTKNGSGVLQIMEFKNVGYILPSNPGKCSNSSIKACEGMKHTLMRNGEWT